MTPLHALKCTVLVFKVKNLNFDPPPLKINSIKSEFTNNPKQIPNAYVQRIEEKKNLLLSAK
jgi:hypothetical protein